MERSFAHEVEMLRRGDGEHFEGEGILAITKALLQSGVSYVGGYQGAPVSHLMDVLTSDSKGLMSELGIHTEVCANEAAACAMLAASVNYPIRGAVTWKSTVGTNVASDALSNIASQIQSASATVMLGEIATAASFSVYGRLPASTLANTGTSFTGVTDTVRDTTALLRFPSLITNDTTRVDACCVPVGSSSVLLYMTDRSTDCHVTTGTLPDRLSVPVLLLYVAEMPVPAVLASSSSPSRRPLAIVAVADSMCTSMMWSASNTVNVDVMAVAAPRSV